MAITSIVLGLVPFYFFYINNILNLILRMGGLNLGLFSRVSSSKAEKRESYNSMEKSRSIIGIPAIIFNAIGFLMIFLGILDFRSFSYISHILIFNNTHYLIIIFKYTLIKNVFKDT